MPGMNLKQPGFTYSACGPSTKRKKTDWKVYVDWKYRFYLQNELAKACFQHNIVYGKSKDLTKRTKSDKFLRDQAFQIASDLKYDGSQKELASMVTSFLIKCLVKVVLTLRLQISLLLNQIIRKFKKRKVNSSFRDNIWGVDVANMQSLNKYNKGIKYLLFAIDIFSKYVWVVSLKDKRRYYYC